MLVALSFVTFAGVSPGNEKTARNTYSKACVHTAVPVPIGLEIRFAFVYIKSTLYQAHPAFSSAIGCGGLF